MTVGVVEITSLGVSTVPALELCTVAWVLNPDADEQTGRICLPSPYIRVLPAVQRPTNDQAAGLVGA
eukprot:scaffold2455_cov387-Prasinococcus_capsulatus_cf.AAC.10